MNSDHVHHAVEHIIASRGTAGLRRAIAQLQDDPRHPDVADLVQACQADELSHETALATLEGICWGLDRSWRTQDVQVVWTGPSVANVPVRATAAVLIDLINQSKRELVLMTYSASRSEQIRHAMAEAVHRGVRIDVVVETKAGAASAITGDEPALAFVGLSGVRIWHWPLSARATPKSKMHAKLAVADGRELFVSSVNLTQPGVHDSLEAGILVRGGTAPVRALEYVRALQSSGRLARMNA